MRTIKFLLVILFSIAIAACGSGGDNPPPATGSISGKVTLSGTVATGAPLANAQITIKDKNGVTITTTTDEFGKYTGADVTTLTAPYLMRVLNRAGTGYLYSVGSAGGTANIHPFTDLIIRNWYIVAGSDVDTEFSGTLIAANLPTVAGINTIASVIRSILLPSMNSAGVATNFNMLTTPFDAVPTDPFDQVLEQTNVAISSVGVVTIVAVAPISGGTSILLDATVASLAVADTAPPSDPTNLVGMPASTSAIVLFWNASTDNVGVAGYNVYSVDTTSGAATKIATTPYPSYSHTGLTSGSHCYQVEAYDAATPTNKSAKTATACATPLADGVLPTTPTNLTATAFSASQIDLTWTASTDNVGVVGYDLYRDGIKVATASGLAYSDTGLASSTSYAYTVRAKDAVPNVSVASTVASATTGVGTPSAPTGVTATATIGQATISWIAVNGAATYNLYMATQAGVTKSNALADAMTHVNVTSPYTHTGLTNGTTYYFVVTALNAAVPGESIESAQVSATPMSTSLSGTVSGAVASGVTITVTDAAGVPLTAITAANGSYSVADLTNGNYTVTPSRTGYTFSPISTTVTITSGVNLTGKNFVASVATAPTYTLSGAVTGPWVEGVTVTLSGTGSGTTTTNASGAYSFANLPAGTYNLVPSLAGYTIPAATGVVVNAATVQNFVATSAIASFSISGTVSYAGAKTGTIYLRVYQGSGCTGCSPEAGTTIPSIALTGGAYTIRGLRSGGNYVVKAEMDTLNTGAPNAGNPTGSSTAITNMQANATGVNVTVVDLITPPTPVTPTTGLTANPSSGAAFIGWDMPENVNRAEIASAYKIYWGPDAAATTGTPITVTARGEGWHVLSGLTNGDPLYYKISACVGTTATPCVTESAQSAVIGPVTIGATTGLNTVSGTVSYTGTATGPMIVGVHNDATGIYFTRIASPVSGGSYSVAGIPSGSWSSFAFIDMNNNGHWDTGDIGTDDDLNITVSTNTTSNLTLSSVSTTARVTTGHGFDGGTNHWYNLNMEVRDGTKLVTSVTLISGRNVAVPFDLGKSWSFYAWANLGATVPNVGDSYGFKVTYSDGTTANISGSVTGVLGTSAMATNLLVNVGSPNTRNIPLFTWAAPTAPPASYTYQLSVYQSGVGGSNWWYPDGNGLPSTTLSAVYNVDGRANPASLLTGATYIWEVEVRDANRNSARYQATPYTP